MKKSQARKSVFWAFKALCQNTHNISHLLFKMIMLRLENLFNQIKKNIFFYLHVLLVLSSHDIWRFQISPVNPVCQRRVYCWKTTLKLILLSPNHINEIHNANCLCWDHLLSGQKKCFVCVFCVILVIILVFSVFIKQCLWRLYRSEH